MLLRTGVEALPQQILPTATTDRPYEGYCVFRRESIRNEEGFSKCLALILRQFTTTLVRFCVPCASRRALIVGRGCVAQSPHMGGTSGSGVWTGAEPRTGSGFRRLSVLTGSVFVSSGTETTHSGQSSTDDGESLDVQQASGITEESAYKNRKAQSRIVATKGLSLNSEPSFSNRRVPGNIISGSPQA